MGACLGSKNQVSTAAIVSDHKQQKESRVTVKVNSFGGSQGICDDSQITNIDAQESVKQVSKKDHHKP